MSSRYIKRSTMANWYDRQLAMSIPDIVKNYREAKYPAKQIDILADMNDTNPSRIAWLLKRAGCDVPVKKMPRPPRNPDTPDYVALWEQSEDARKCDEYKILKENEIMIEAPETNAAEMQQKPDPAADVQQKPDRKPYVKPEIKPAPVFASVYMDTVDGFWSTYLGVRYGIALTHDDIVHLVELSDIARAAAGGAA